MWRKAPPSIKEEEMKYLLTFARDKDRMYEGTEEEMKAGMEAWNEFNREAIEAGVLIANEALELPSSATTVRFGDGGDLSVIDGPFTETKEQLGGFCLIDVGSREEALGWAKKVPLAPDSLLEVRAVKDLTPYGYEGSATPGPIKAQASA
jgi:hypothetical protein